MTPIWSQRIWKTNKQTHTHTHTILLTFSLWPILVCCHTVLHSVKKNLAAVDNYINRTSIWNMEKKERKKENRALFCYSSQVLHTYSFCKEFNTVICLSQPAHLPLASADSWQSQFGLELQGSSCSPELLLSSGLQGMLGWLGQAWPPSSFYKHGTEPAQTCISLQLSWPPIDQWCGSNTRSKLRSVLKICIQSEERTILENKSCIKKDGHLIGVDAIDLPQLLHGPLRPFSKLSCASIPLNFSDEDLSWSAVSNYMETMTSPSNFKNIWLLDKRLN